MRRPHWRAFTHAAIASETATFTVRATSFDSRALRAPMEGQFGPTRAGLYWTVPSSGGGTNRYVYETQDDGSGRYCGIDPGTFVAGLSGWSGIEVQHPAGVRTAAQRATTIRAAITAAGISGWVVGGSGADVAITGPIDAQTCTVAGMLSTSTRGQYGTRRRTAQFATSDLSGRIGQFGVSPGQDVVVTGLGMYLDDHSAQVRISMYTGGTSGSLTGTTLRAEVITTGSATGWVWVAFTPAQCFTLSASTNFRIVAKSNSTAEPGYIGIGDLTGTDFDGARNMEVYDTMSTDPTVAFPATLAGEGIDTSNAVYAMMAFQYMAVGSTAVRTSRVGVQISTVTDLGATSSLTAPDAGGADLFMGAPATGLSGWEYSAWAIAHATAHTTQGRGFIVEGGSVGNAAGGTVVWQSQTAGSATQQWVEVAISAGTAHDGTVVTHWGVRNNAATFDFRFAFNANRTQATPDHNQADFTDPSEYEIFRSVNGDGTGGNVHETNPAVAVASPVATDGGFVANNTNYPGAYLVLRYPADTVVAA